MFFLPNVLTDSLCVWNQAVCVNDTAVPCKGSFALFFSQADLLHLVHIEHSVLGLTDLLQPGRVRNSMAH